MEVQDPIFNNDVQYMKNLVGKSIEVTTIEDKTHQGILYVIDPITKTVVLTNPIGPRNTVDLIMYNSIKTLVVVPDSGVANEFLFNKESRRVTPETTLELERKKASLKRWLKQNLIDIQEDGEVLKLGDELVIESPYGPEQCLCSNVIVLDRIRKIISEMP